METIVRTADRAASEARLLDDPFPLPDSLLRQAGVRLFAILITIEVTLMILHTWVVRSPPGTHSKEFWQFFHLDREGNLPTWFSSSQFFLLAIVFAAIFLVERYDSPARRTARVWLLCAVGALFLSIDEAAALHEMVGTILGSALHSAEPGSWVSDLGQFPSYYWTLIYVPIVVPAAGVVLIILWRRLGRERHAVVGGALCAFVGAVVVDFLEGRYGTPDHTLIPVTVSGMEFLFDIFLLEEFLEMFGVSLILGAFVQTLSNRIMWKSRLPHP